MPACYSAAGGCTTNAGGVRVTDDRAPAAAPARDALRLFTGTNDRWHDRDPELDWDAAAAALGGGAHGAGAVARLGLVNCFQWHLEDACRAARADAAAVARLKAEIDRSNQRRVRAVDEINAAVMAELPCGGPGTRLALTTPGDLLDRLSVLALKRCHALRRGDALLAEMLTEQVDDVCQGLDELVDDLRRGRLRVKLYPTVKLYGADRTQEVRG
jgi:hypothetical protein